MRKVNIQILNHQQNFHSFSSFSFLISIIIGVPLFNKYVCFKKYIHSSGIPPITKIYLKITTLSICLLRIYSGVHLSEV